MTQREESFEAGYQCGLKAAQAAQPAQIPEGWKLVPVEPTQEMVYQGIRAARCLWTPDSNRDFTGAYKAMLAAAPSTKEQT